MFGTISDRETWASCGESTMVLWHLLVTGLCQIRALLHGNPPDAVRHPIAARKCRLEKERLIREGENMIVDKRRNAFQVAKRREEASKQAFATILTQDEDTDHAVLLAKALTATSPGYNLIVLVSPSVSLESRAKLVGLQCMVRQVGCQFDETQLWKLTEFQMIVYLRLGAFPLRTLYYLFEKAETRATTTLSVIALRPDQSVAETLSELRKTFAEAFELVLRKSFKKLRPSRFSHLDEWIAKRDPVDTLSFHVISYNKDWRPWLRDHPLSRLPQLLEGRCDVETFVTMWLTRYEAETAEAESDSDDSSEFTLI